MERDWLVTEREWDHSSQFMARQQPTSTMNLHVVKGSH